MPSRPMAGSNIGWPETCSICWAMPSGATSAPSSPRPRRPAKCPATPSRTILLTSTKWSISAPAASARGMTSCSYAAQPRWIERFLHANRIHRHQELPAVPRYEAGKHSAPVRAGGGQWHRQVHPVRRVLLSQGRPVDERGQGVGQARRLPRGGELQFRLEITGYDRLVTYALKIRPDRKSGRPVVEREILRYKRGAYGAPFRFL